MNKYNNRIVDKLLELKMDAFGAVQIVGPKFCGKTTTAKQNAKSSIEFQKIVNKEELLVTAEVNPSLLLVGNKPRLVDEWQDAPAIWDAIRVFYDESDAKGLFILTGLTSKKVKTSHTGTGRIANIKMYPMSLFESNESNGTVSLKDLFNNPDCLNRGCKSELSIEDLIFAACRGVWPSSIKVANREAKLEIAKDYFEQIYLRDMHNIDGVKRNSELMKAILKSYARNISTLAKVSNITADVNTTVETTAETVNNYIEVLQKLFIVEDVSAWCPQVRYKSAIRSGHKRCLSDPSLAVAGLGVEPEYFYQDLKTFGFIFESLCFRDLRVYSQALRGELSYYRDRYGLEADAVLHLPDGRYALIEFKLDGKDIETGASHLIKLEHLINEYNQNEKQCPLPLPTVKMVITGTEYGYKREDGVLIVPIGCLKD